MLNLIVKVKPFNRVILYKKVLSCRLFSENTVKTPSLEELNRNDQSYEKPKQSTADLADSQAEIDELKEKIREIDEKYKRALAETENTRARMMRQIEEAKIFGIQSFCKDLLEVADVLQSAIKSAPQDQNNNEPFKSLLSGVVMTDKQIQSIFRRHGLDQINPIGAKFDPNEHYAMFQVFDDSKEPGTVAQVNQIGYKLHGRIIRPAMVGVFAPKN